jgi:hypothetical protein
VGVGHLQPGRQADLFAAGAAAENARLDHVLDGIRGRFGDKLLTRASLLPGRPRGSGT